MNCIITALLPPMIARIARLALISIGLCVLPASGEVHAERISTLAGRSTEQVTEITREPDGKLRIVHAGGVWRIQQSELTEVSQIALGLTPQISALKSVDDLETLQTLDGRRFEGIRRCVVSPSDIRFIHSTGSATVRFEELPAHTQRRFGYVEAKAAAYVQQEAKEREQAEEKLLSRLLAVGPTSESDSDSIYVDSSPPTASVRQVRKVTRSEARVLAAASDGPWVWVAGYYRDDGTYVPGHYRTFPDSNLANNWSTAGNHNPVTGERGTIRPPGSVVLSDRGLGTGSRALPTASSGRVRVRGYFRKDGTYVRPHTRRR
jgi:hypothetical protein